MPESCLRPDCGKVRYCRGLCVNCHSSAYKLVKKSRTSWAELENAGKALRPTKAFGQRGPASTWLLS